MGTTTHRPARFLFSAGFSNICGKGVKIVENVKIQTIDDLGRIIVPAELREDMGWNVRDEVELYRENDTVVMRKAEMGK